MSEVRPLEGVHSHVRLGEHPDERAMSIWVRHVHYKASTNEMRTLARHILERADAVDAEANRKRRVLDEVNTPEPAAPQEPVLTDEELQAKDDAERAQAQDEGNQ